MKKLIIIEIIIAVISIIAIPATIFADPPQKVNTFVCPVLNAIVGAHNPNANPITGGDFTLFPGKAGDPANSPVNVPVHATNRVGGGIGNGNPGGSHSAPGEAGYSPIWNID